MAPLCLSFSPVTRRSAFTPNVQSKRTSKRIQHGVAPAHIVAGIFDNFGKSTNDEKDREYERQQKILADRKTGKSVQDANARRREVAQYMKLPKAEQRKIMEERDPSPIYEEEPKVKLFNVIIPIAPFGMPKYDNGGRFDLKAAYTDEGYEDESADVMGKLFGFLKPKSKAEDEEGGGKKTTSSSKKK